MHKHQKTTLYRKAEDGCSLFEGCECGAERPWYPGRWPTNGLVEWVQEWIVWTARKLRPIKWAVPGQSRWTPVGDEWEWSKVA